MSPTVAHPKAFRRMIATAALALIAATGITTATAVSASAVGADSASFTWLSAALASDTGTIGVPDGGDTVTLTFQVAAKADAPDNLNWLMLMSAYYLSIEGPEALAPGALPTTTATSP